MGHVPLHQVAGNAVST